LLISEDGAMAQARLFSARPQGRTVFPSIDAVVARTRPSDPLLCLRPAVIAGAARRFVDFFPGDVLYAVKCNPEPRVLRALWAGGVRHFDCASLAEVGLGRMPSGSALLFMSAPSASSPRPMGGQWHWPRRQSRAAAFRSTSSMSAAGFRSAIPAWRRRRSEITSPQSRPAPPRCPAVLAYG